MTPLEKSSKILIIGSGVFGISTAMWLARTGYSDVTVLDMQDTASTGYDPRRGIESASADLNKIVRFSYGTDIAYQRLAAEAAELWNEANDLLAATPDNELPETLRAGEKRLWWNVGYLRMALGDEYSRYERETLESMEKEGLRHLQFKSDDPNDMKRAQDQGWLHKIDPCRRQERFGIHKAVLDSSGGFVCAYKSCCWVQYLARKLGVKFILGSARGRVVKIETTNNKPVVETADGTRHAADLVVVSGGGWTPSLIPETQCLLETTAGSIVTIQLPKHRKDLWERYAPENSPVVVWGSHEGKFIYSFPRDEDGVIKIGWHKTKYTNFETVDGRRVSVPRTSLTEGEENNSLPQGAVDGIKDYISTNFPDLVDLGFASTKLCWYTDSIDNNFVVDHVPGRPELFVCSGGSGHGFKFLPVLGREVVKILEGEETVYGRMWRWRSASGTAGEKRNGLEEGEEGPRLLSKQRMVRLDELVARAC